MLENIRMALESLRTNKMRSVLTMLGIIIGIGAVIGIMSMGSAMTSMVTEQMGEFGAYNIYVGIEERKSSFTADQSQISAIPEDKDLMSFTNLEEMKELFSEEIEDYSIETSSVNAQVKKGRAYANVSVLGVNRGYEPVNDVKLKRGRFISQDDIDANRKVCVVSDRMVSKIFGDENPIGKTVRVYGDDGIQEYGIVGIYTYEQNMQDMMMGSGDDLRTKLYVPITSWQIANGGNKNYSMASVKLKSTADVTKATDDINVYWERVYRRNPQWKVNAFNLQSMVDQTMTMVSTIQNVIAIIGGISLLVGGIGVMNIMLVSVTERTHEIGIRKALGAREGKILFQFVTEAGILSLTGGFIGLILGFLLGQAGSAIIASMSNMSNISASLSPVVIIFTLLFSMGIGVFFGLYPAYKAAKLDPIDALRYE